MCQEGLRFLSSTVLDSKSFGIAPQSCFQDLNFDMMSLNYGRTRSQGLTCRTPPSYSAVVLKQVTERYHLLRNEWVSLRTAMKFRWLSLLAV